VDQREKVDGRKCKRCDSHKEKKEVKEGRKDAKKIKAHHHGNPSLKGNPTKQRKGGKEVKTRGSTGKAKQESSRVPGWGRDSNTP